jgi:fructose-bisphosphate aldolase class II
LDKNQPSSFDFVPHLYITGFPFGQAIFDMGDILQTGKTFRSEYNTKEDVIMPLVSMTEMLKKANAEGYAVGQFNLNNLEFTQAILQAAQEENSPVILGVSEGAARYMGGFKTIVALVKALMEEYGVTVPVAIHLDHGSSYESCAKAIHAGFTSVMIDASHHPFEENIETTSKVVELAHFHGVSVEAELGVVGGQEDDVIADGVIYADPQECEELVKRTGIDCLAPALGSVHGPYKGEPNLGFKEMEDINNRAGVPLVLHGGTGIPTHDIQKAISFGTAKINVNTENQIASAKAVRETLAAKTEEYDPRKYLGPARDAIKDTVKGKMREFGSSNKA